MSTYDVAVLGGGLAGLCAARDLSHAGHSVLLIEARDRLGGRAWTERAALGGADIELGGMYVHPSQTPIVQELRRYGLELSPPSRPSSFRWLQGGARRDGASPVPVDQLGHFERAVRWLDEQAAKVDPTQSLHDQALDDLDVALPDLLGNLSLPAETFDLLHSALGEHCSGDWANASALPLFAAIAHSGGVADFFLMATFASKIQGGTSALIEALTDDLLCDIRFSDPVRAIHTAEREAVVITDADSFRAGLVVCTLPLNVLGDISFEPQLSAPRQKCVDVGHVGRGAKVYALVRGVAAGTLAYAPGPKVQLVVAEQTTSLGEVLVCFGEGPLDGNDIDAVARALEPVFPEVKVLDSRGHDWGSDPWARGTWAVPPVGSRKTFGALAGPEGRLFFATADTGPEWESCLAGGVEAGWAAADWART